MDTLKESALAYAKKGWCVFPLKTKTKKPATTHGLKDATVNLEKIKKWWSENPNYNIGIRTGAESGIVVLDLDIKRKKIQPHSVIANGVEFAETLFDWEPEGPYQKTGGGGLQAIYKHPGYRCKNGENMFASDMTSVTGIDIRGDGGYIVAPPSIHPNGEQYHWQENPNIDLPPIPRFIEKYYKDLLKDKINESSNKIKAKIDPSKILTGVSEGERNAKLFRYACRLRQKNYDLYETIALIKAAADAADGEYPGPKDEPIEKMVDRIYSTYPPGEKEDDENEESEEDQVNYKILSQVTPKKLKWLWPDRIPIGKLSLFAGDPGLGKSMITCDLASRVTTGTPWPDTPGVQNNMRGDVIFLSAEDDIEDTIRPRLDAVKANCDKIIALESIKEKDKNGKTKERPFNLQKDVHRLEHICKGRKVKLIIIDPLSAYTGDSDSHNNAEVRVMLTPLQVLAQKYGIAIMGVTHLRKSSGKAIYRAMGSIAFSAAARAVWGAALDNEDESGNTKVFLPIKTNLSDGADGLRYSIKEVVIDGLGPIPAVQWDRERIPKSEVEKHLSDDPISKHGRPASKSQQAKKFLEKILGREGALPAEALIQFAEDAGISKRTLKRAKKDLGIKSQKGEESWEWTL